MPNSNRRRTRSEYYLVCECGHEVVSATKSCKCSNCGRRIRIVWPAALPGQGDNPGPAPVEPTISGKLEMEEMLSGD